MAPSGSVSASRIRTIRAPSVSRAWVSPTTSWCMRFLAIFGSNGTVQFGVTSPGGNATPFQKCLPTTDVGAAVLVLWGELGYGGSGEGIFLRTQGTKPNRTFTISWQSHFIVSAPTEANAQVTFRENSRTITFQYGEVTFQTLVTIGIQSRSQLAYTEWYCGGKGRYPVNGMRLNLGYVA
jgi:hypothetical protein